ncbi:guanosine-3',5'-bis(diphosphate) 3'-diphosphatase [Cavenderia fasciculata]|uniref:Guanosine-3',5'-bis(diphosphate) 3'-pyrophosphohydrolase MESH1 n=1 Tax=Cavenderia fasciculata TaxID=261658 RepID=F4PQ84_CACFS|nr:guanosine-3',5'-bis(diphosphate) 3'-diphosphatase [Cavenderia fasciculata]EGG22547.1 guanosine-3',5'-bis(diphosphate) 3'-diphosphatase [Cavenderia fasciculata]|eukprot:XP_004360398.1 guanosine-3',5'-bis(diphosphate) 3'-diphosphatase [Cavenderia fasciculata]
MEIIVLKEVITTVDFAAKKHRDQRRKDKHSSPYINHPIGVALNVINVGQYYDVATVQAALLHDTVEDTDCTEEEIRKEFGSEVASIVMDVTDDKSLSKVDRKKFQVSHAPHIQDKSKIVKMADKLYNLSDIIKNAPPSWSLLTIQGYFVWGKKVCDGLRGVNASLEEALDQLFQSNVIFKGEEYPVVPCKTIEEEDQLLETYYQNLR